MKNLETKLHTILLDRVSPHLSHVAVNSCGRPTIHTLHRVDSDYRFETHPLDLSSTLTSRSISLSSEPIALSVHNDTPLLACRDGALLSLKSTPPEHLGDFTDDDADKSGMLTMECSPDGCLLLVVSPVMVSVLSADLEVLAEIPCEGVATNAFAAWRNDGDCFVVVRFVADLITGFVADRECETVNKLDLELNVKVSCVDWEPRPGGLVTVSHENSVSFFERNGLRHSRSDFVVGHDISALKWSPDARVLLVIGAGHLDLWMRSNYVWRCKKRLHLDRCVGAFWDEDDSQLLRVFREDGDVTVLRFAEVCSSNLLAQSGPIVSVTDGSDVFLTNLGAGIIPPPMNHGSLSFPSPVESVCCTENGNLLGFLLSTGTFETVEFDHPPRKPNTSASAQHSNHISYSKCAWILQEPSSSSESSRLPYRSPVLLANNLLAVVSQQGPWLKHQKSHDTVLLFELKAGEKYSSLIGRYQVDALVTSMRECSLDPTTLVLTLSSGFLVHVTVDGNTGLCSELSRIESVAAKDALRIREAVTQENERISYVHSEDGRLERFNLETRERVILSEICTSFTILEDFLVLSTRRNELHCLKLDNSSPQAKAEYDATIGNTSQPSNGTPVASDWQSSSPKPCEIRPIDAGSMIIAALPDKISLVLQAPRGNLEILAPRPAVLKEVDRLVKGGDFSDAFALCRRQRIDMNHIVNVNFPLFMKDIDQFVTQVGVGDQLSVFMSLLSDDSDRSNHVCKAIVKALQKIDDDGRFTTAIITGLIRQDPSDYAGALVEVHRAAEFSPELARQAIDYLFVLVKNHEFLYHHALGTYNLDLTTLVAECSQLDPAIYQQELHELRQKDERERRISIDMKLKRYDNAVQHIYQGGRDSYQTCVSLCLKHSLYTTCLRLFRDEKDIYNELLYGYARELRRTGRFQEAAAIFRQVDDNENASECYRRAGMWQHALQAVSMSALSLSDKVEVWRSLAVDLEEEGRVVESANIRVSFLRDLSGALTLLAEAEEWDAAFDIGAKARLSQPNDELVEGCISQLFADVVYRGGLFVEHLKENRVKLQERKERLLALRKTKQMMKEHIEQTRLERETDSDVFSESTASSLSNLSDATFRSKSSVTSLYSSTQEGPLSVEKLEKKALKRKQKQSKKRIRAGHPREEEAIIVHLRKLLPTEFMFGRAERLVSALLFAKAAGIAISIVANFEAYTKNSLALPADVLEDEKIWLSKKSTWIGGLPKALHESTSPPRT